MPDTSHWPQYIQFPSDISGGDVVQFRTAWIVTFLLGFPRHEIVLGPSIAEPGSRCPRCADLTNGFPVLLSLFLLDEWKTPPKT